MSSDIDLGTGNCGDTAAEDVPRLADIEQIYHAVHTAAKIGPEPVEPTHDP